jgi:hypothetical protein
MEAKKRQMPHETESRKRAMTESGKTKEAIDLPVGKVKRSNAKSV